MRLSSVHKYKLVKDTCAQHNFEYWDYAYDPHLLLVKREVDGYWTENKQIVFDKFKNFVFKKQIVEVDFVESFKKVNLNVYDYDWLDCCPVDSSIIEKDQEWFDIFENKKTKEIIKMFDRDYINEVNEYECLLFSESNVFKNRGKTSFLKNTELNDLNKDFEFIINQEMLDEVLIHFEDHAPIHDWVLGEDEVIHLSW